ncbi:MAG: hypothetical protein LBF28_03210 [Rickettsiales bacterium]|jgi:hypothetical protein|nr:hypothetical protein [Rickettsiales bacterium]
MENLKRLKEQLAVIESADLRNNYSYNDVLNEYADLQRKLSYKFGKLEDSFSYKEYIEYKNAIIEPVLGGIGTFFNFYGDKFGGFAENYEKLANLQLPKNMKKQQVDVINEIRASIKEFKDMVKKCFGVDSRDKFAEIYGGDYRIRNNIKGLAAQKYKLLVSDIKKEQDFLKRKEAESQEFERQNEMRRKIEVENARSNENVKARNLEITKSAAAKVKSLTGGNPGEVSGVVKINEIAKKKIANKKHLFKINSARMLARTGNDKEKYRVVQEIRKNYPELEPEVKRLVQAARKRGNRE